GVALPSTHENGGQPQLAQDGGATVLVGQVDHGDRVDQPLLFPTPVGGDLLLVCGDHVEENRPVLGGEPFLDPADALHEEGLCAEHLERSGQNQPDRTRSCVTCRHVDQVRPVVVCKEFAERRTGARVSSAGSMVESVRTVKVCDSPARRVTSMSSTSASGATRSTRRATSRVKEVARTVTR